MNRYDCIIIGAGAAGMMCALEAARRGRRVALLDHAPKIGEKIRISGGGRCNFTNLKAASEHFLSANPHFCKSALKRYRPADFLQLVERHDIRWFEKEKGQLFCRESAQQIVVMLLRELADGGVRPMVEQNIEEVRRTTDGFELSVNGAPHACRSLVVATGGKSIPKIGASGFGYRLAEQFGLRVIEPRPGLVPLTFDTDLKQEFQELSGVSLEARISCGKTSFLDPLLFTHRGLSGPAILQISNYWREGERLTIDLAPEIDLSERLRESARTFGRQRVEVALADVMPRRLAAACCRRARVEGRLAELSRVNCDRLIDEVSHWRVRPLGTEGYRTAEVTLGGVDTDELSSKTFETKKTPGLYFIGEVVDVTGWLGGYNFQWAWSSGWCAGQYV